MAPDPSAAPPPAEQAVVARIDRAARRAAIGRRQAGHPVWSGLGMAGLVGWSVTVPTVLGTMAGIALDHHYPGRHSWTLS
jgi:ATP synthase protein I